MSTHRIGRGIRRLCAFASIFVVAGAQTAWADYFDTGNELYSFCQKPRGSGFEWTCLGTISGGYDMMKALGYSCQDGGVTRDQLKDVVVKYLADHPEFRNKPAVFSIVLAVRAAFSCESKEQR